MQAPKCSFVPYYPALVMPVYPGSCCGGCPCCKCPQPRYTPDRPLVTDVSSLLTLTKSSGETTMRKRATFTATAPAQAVTERRFTWNDGSGQQTTTLGPDVTTAEFDVAPAAGETGTCVLVDVNAGGESPPSNVFPFPLDPPVPPTPNPPDAPQILGVEDVTTPLMRGKAGQQWRKVHACNV